MSALCRQLRTSSHRQRNFADKAFFAPVKANLPLLLDNHLFDDTGAETPFVQVPARLDHPSPSSIAVMNRQRVTIPSGRGRQAWTKRRISLHWSLIHATLPQLPVRRLALIGFVDHL
jgi:hypothetical protein